MSSVIPLILHHHGGFSNTQTTYIGGKIEVISNFDTDLLSFRDLEEFSLKYNYDPDSLVYFKYNGNNFKDGLRLMYDDKSVRDMVELCSPYGKLELYVDHVILDPLLKPQTHLEINNEWNIYNDDQSSEDPGDASEKMNDVNDILECSSDDELVRCRRYSQNFRDNMKLVMSENNASEIDESDFDSDGVRSLDSSSEDENMRIGYVGPPRPRKKKKKMAGVTKTNIDGKFKWEVGMQFVNMEEFRQLVREYGIKERRAISFVTNDNDRSQVCCEKDCPFYIWCSRDNDSKDCTIKSLNDQHLCTKPYKNKMATVKYLTETYGDKIRKNPQWKIKDMIETIEKDLEIEIPVIKAKRLRKAALDGIHESLKDHYSRVRDFAHELLLTNPKNKIDIRTTRLNEGDSNHFKRIYICYHALKEGWKAGCRPVIGLDGCFLKTVCGGQLLSAVGRDGNNQMFPIAYAVVESESTDSWKWYIELLKDDLDLRDGSGYTVISDQQKGLENAMKDILPNAEHRFCARHLYSNFRKRFPSLLLRRAFWSVSCATHTVAHQKAMKQLERISKAAHEQLSKLNPKMWCKAFFSKQSEADNVENNMSECFNAWIINERYMPLLTMLQEIHLKIMTRIKEKRDQMLHSELQLCPKIKKKLDKVVAESREWRATWDGQRKFLVKQGIRAVTVDLANKSCDCRVFDLTGVPCAHAVAAIHDRRHKPIDYVSKYYKRERYLASYNHPLEAIKGEEYWGIYSTDELLPPPIPKKLRGRPKRLRRKEDWEGGSKSKATNTNSSQELNVQRFSHKRKMHCSLCRLVGHRKNKCPSKSGDQETCDAEGATEHVEQMIDKNAEETVNLVENHGEKVSEENNIIKTPKEMRRAKLQCRKGPKKGKKKVMPGEKEQGEAFGFHLQQE